MTKTSQDFTLYQGQTKQVTVPCVDGNDDPIDLTGAEVHWRLFADPSDAVASSLMHKATTLGGDDALSLVDVNANSGELDSARFLCVPADSDDLESGLYFHELHETDAIGNESPLATGWVTIKPSPAGRA